MSYVTSFPYTHDLHPFRRSHPLLALKPTPSPHRPTPGSTSPSQPPRARTGWWPPGTARGQGPLSTGRAWMTGRGCLVACPTNSSTTACRYSQSIFIVLAKRAASCSLVLFFVGSVFIQKGCTVSVQCRLQSYLPYANLYFKTHLQLFRFQWLHGQTVGLDLFKAKS